LSDYFYCSKARKVTIGNSIRQLLEERKKVIFPGFGNLEIKEAGSGVSASGKRIDPPGPSIKFDNSFSKDDNLLATTLAEESGLDLEEARQQILELVDAIRFALDKGEPYSLENAGTFSRDDDGKIHFQPEKGWVVDPGQYGLESMDLLELEDLPEEKEPEKAAEPETVEAAVDAKDTTPPVKTEKTI
jgi:nucleoid DNA-binding protein